MFRLASTLGLAGFVRNDREGVWIEVEGAPATLVQFLEGLPRAAPAGARIDQIEAANVATCLDRDFRIAESPAADPGVRAAIPADLAPCDDCLRELADPRDRRHRYPFTNCTACGPRYTIVRETPYDRATTTMARFTLCDACRREYEDPADRRFHAEPNACPACGPRARLVAPDGSEVLSDDAAIRAAAQAIADGAIVAVKGAGGFVLACDARSESAVSALRARKRRPHKPFAVMGRSLAELDHIAIIDAEARTAIVSRERPIVLVPARAGSLAAGIAPGLGDVGVFLPPTPLQHLLVHDGPAFQVMTSGNLAEEPIARENGEALARLVGIADLFLVHDRDVHARADDSVQRATKRGSICIRRARGYVPGAIAMPAATTAVIAVGGHERNTVCLAAGGQAVISQHVGDLEHPASDKFFREVIAHLEELLGTRAQAVVHDLHPDYRSTRWALASGLPAIAVQHHHAHVASCLAEHGRNERVTGIAFDGTGLGSDGTLWGGEVLVADLTSCRRAGHLRPLALAGGAAAIEQPWRIAAAALLDCGESLDMLSWVPPRDRQRISALLASTLPVHATGAGRWFDAVGALLGAARAVSYDGQAAAQLEALAGAERGEPLETAITMRIDAPFEIDLRPAIRELAAELRRGRPAPRLAARFHTTLVDVIRRACRLAGHPTVVLTGGCFQNRRLVEDASHALELDGFEVLTHRRVPPNDGGIALGQAALAAHRMETSTCA